MAGAQRARSGSFHDLIGRYYRSPDLLDPGDRTREVYRGVIERWRAKYGNGLVRDLRSSHVEKKMAEMLPHRTAANMLPKRLSALLNFAIRQGFVATNPVLATRPYKVETDGFHAWTEDEISLFEQRHSVGTKARLAFHLMLWTGQRGGDARVMGPQHIRNKRLVVTQEKTGATVSLPILALLSEHGKPFSRKGFGNKFRRWCDDASLPHCSAHGLRKAAARRFAEAGALINRSRLGPVIRRTAKARGTRPRPIKPFFPTLPPSC